MEDPRFTHMLRILRVQAGIAREDALSPSEKIVLESCRAVEAKTTNENLFPIDLSDVAARDYVHRLCSVYRQQLENGSHLGRYVAILSYLATFVRNYPALEEDVKREFSTIPIPAK